MAIESPVNPDAGWMEGEDKTLRFTVTGDTDGIAGWALEYALYPARKAGAPLIVISSAGGPVVAHEADGLDPAIVTVVVTAEQVAAAGGAGTYQQVLRRTDVGARNVLSFGQVVIGKALTA